MALRAHASRTTQTQKKLRAEVIRIRARMNAVRHGGRAWLAYRQTLVVMKAKLAALRKRVIVESPEEE